MKSFYAPDGSLIQHVGSLDNDRILLILGRDNFVKDAKAIEPFLEWMSGVVLQFFCKIGFYPKTHIWLKTEERGSVQTG
jgi:hypothetical protein